MRGALGGGEAEVNEVRDEDGRLAAEHFAGRTKADGTGGKSENEERLAKELECIMMSEVNINQGQLVVEWQSAQACQSPMLFLFVGTSSLLQIAGDAP